MDNPVDFDVSQSFVGLLIYFPLYAGHCTCSIPLTVVANECRRFLKVTSEGQSLGSCRKPDQSFYQQATLKHNPLRTNFNVRM